MNFTFHNVQTMLAFCLWASTHCRKKMDITQVDGLTYGINGHPVDASIIAAYLTRKMATLGGDV